MSIHVVIPGPPVPKERPRRGADGQWYTPQKTRDAEQSIADYAIVQNRDAAPNAKARFHVDIHLYCKDFRFDLDNASKTALDGLTKSGIVWKDDSQVDALYVLRIKADAAGERTEIWIRAELT